MAGTTRSGKKGIEAGEASGVASPVATEKYLKGPKFPANKEQLLNYAKRNSAPTSVMNAIEKLPNITFNSPVEISKTIANA